MLLRTLASPMLSPDRRRGWSDTPAAQVSESETKPTNAWKTGARSARPASVRLSRTLANHERIAVLSR
jgi:hypothetical protein